MPAEGDSPSIRGARLDAIIGQLETMLAELDGLGFSRIALPVNDAIEVARATRGPLRCDRADHEDSGNATPSG